MIMINCESNRFYYLIYMKYYYFDIISEKIMAMFENKFLLYELHFTSYAKLYTQQ